jgi:tetratricopeptide (TPR) repeat protein
MQTDSDIIDIFSNVVAHGNKGNKLFTPLSEDNWQNEINEIPLFMGSIGTKELNVEQEAIQALVYDGTPEEIALNFKNQGNEVYQESPNLWKNALHFYTQGILQQCNDLKLNSILYSNRAAIYLDQENYRLCVEDCKDALANNMKNIKAHYRLGKAYLGLKEYSNAILAFETCLKVGWNWNYHFKD